MVVKTGALILDYSTRKEYLEEYKNDITRYEISFTSEPYIHFGVLEDLVLLQKIIGK